VNLHVYNLLFEVSIFDLKKVKDGNIAGTDLNNKDFTILVNRYHHAPLAAI